MRYSTILYFLGIFLILFSFTMLIPTFIAYFQHDGCLEAFSLNFLLCFSTGLFFWLCCRSSLKREMSLSEGFMVTVLFWIVISAFAAFPFIDSPLQMSVADAVFETISGLTTTGSTVMIHLDTMPKSILFYRQLLQWFGGMGIIILAVAMLPMLGIGGMQLYRAEAPGPIKDSKLSPRITETAKLLWGVYLVITVFCAASYWFAGMSLFDAIGHSFATVSLGGFSSYDQNIGYFNSPQIESVAIVFMLLSAVNYSLYFIAWQKRDLKVLWHDPECRFFIAIVVIILAIVIFGLIFLADYSPSNAIRKGLFETVTVITTTGFTLGDFAHWPNVLTISVMIVCCIGACAGSSGGGIKVIRFLLLFKLSYREFKRLVHPNGFFTVRLNKRTVPNKVLDAVSGFVFIYTFILISFSIILMFLGLDPKTAFAAMVSSLNDAGFGLGKVADNYASINDASKWVLSLAMLLGRLEIFTFLVLFTPTFWRR